MKQNNDEGKYTGLRGGEKLLKEHSYQIIPIIKTQKALFLFCFSALKEVQMKVNPHTGGGGCGGSGTTAKIMIYDGVSVCHTKAILYPTGKTAVWKSVDQLENCAENKFSPKESIIYYRIKPTDIDNDYCVDEVAVILDDQKSTKYMKETDDKWRDGVSDTFGLTKQ